jgi:hypothetical protein
MGISPAIEMLALLRRQWRRISAGAIRLAQRHAERIEFANAIGREPKQ